MAADMAVELKKKGVVSVSLWPGAVQTELINQYISSDEAPPGFDPKVSHFYLYHHHCFVSSRRTSVNMIQIHFPKYLITIYLSQFKEMFSKGETTECSGRCIVELAKGWIF